MKFAVLLAVLWLSLFGAAAHAGNVGFQELVIPNGDEQPLTIGIWYPTDAPARPQPLLNFTQTVAIAMPAAGEALPLVVMSHGTGGWYGEHYDTALALAHAGFVVAAVTHTGDNYLDHSQAQQIWKRPQQVSRVIDYMLGEWAQRGKIDPARVGAFGFSAGEFTVLVEIGGTADLGLTRPHCLKMPTAFECRMKGDISAEDLARMAPPRSAYVADPRIKAAVVAAPALGFTFGRDGLKHVSAPIQLWRAEDDHVLPNPDYAQAVADTLPRAPEYHVVPGADHFDFLAPCDSQLAKHVPEICAEVGGFDRTAFHVTFNAAVVAFLERTLAN